MWRPARSPTDRGVTSQIGVILMISVVIIGIFSLVGFGAIALSDSTSDLTDETAERDLVALADAIDQTAIRRSTTLGSTTTDVDVRELASARASVQARESAGEIEVRVDGTTVLDDTLGVVEYDNPDSDTIIAYQAGMVVSKVEGEAAAIRRDNEFQYRDGAGSGLMLHVVSVTEFASIGESTRISVEGSRDQWPDLAVNAGDTVTIRVTSEFDGAWVRKFDQMLPASRTTITHNSAANEVEAVFTAPSDGAFLHLRQYDIRIE